MEECKLKKTDAFVDRYGPRIVLRVTISIDGREEKCLVSFNENYCNDWVDKTIDVRYAGLAEFAIIENHLREKCAADPGLLRTIVRHGKYVFRSYDDDLIREYEFLGGVVA